MAPPLSSQEDNAAFLDAITYAKKDELDVRESLGLFPESHDKNKNPIFHRERANALRGEVKRIAEAYATSYHGSLEQLQSHISEENTFSEEAINLGHKYGADVWGRKEEGEIRSSAESQGKGIEEHDWDVAKDRTNILFYIRCWLISFTVNYAQTRLPKAKGKGRKRALNDNQNHVEYLSDSSGSSAVPYRAPEPPRMFPTPEPRRQTAPLPSASKTSFSAGARAESASESNRTDTTTPSKRKAQGTHERTPSGKQPKPSPRWNMPVQLREQRADLYSNPLSPTHLYRGKQRQREATCETDTTYRPREATAETETVVDGEEVTPREVDSVLQSAIALANEDSMQYEYTHSPTVAGPSGTYRNPLRQDSVIPDDTQTQTQMNRSMPDIKTCRSRVTLHGNGAITQTHTETRHHRLELFSLLVSYLTGINEFEPNASTYDVEAEERMNFLLNHFSLSLADNQVHDDDAGLRALQTWMAMRHALSSFRHTTQYFGRPGEQWTEYLRGLDDVPCARAMLGYVDLQRECEVTMEGFDEELMGVFDRMTRVTGCIGVDSFQGVRKFNKALLEWFMEGDV